MLCQYCATKKLSTFFIESFSIFNFCEVCNCLLAPDAKSVGFFLYFIPRRRSPSCGKRPERRRCPPDAQAADSYA